MKKKEYARVNYGLVYELNWDILKDKRPHDIIGTVELAKGIFSHMDIKDTAKIAYLAGLVSAQKFPKEDGLVSRIRYWYAQTLGDFKKEVQTELKVRAEKIRRAKQTHEEFEKARQTILKKINGYRSLDGRTNYFKTDGLYQLLDLLEQAPTEDMENMVLTEISTLWKLCRKQTVSLQLAG